MAKKFTVLAVMFLAFGLAWAQDSEKQKTTINWKEVQVVYDYNEVSELTHGFGITETIKSSLNFGKSKGINDCLIKLKKQAASKGYTVIYVDEEATEFKRFDKRGVKITLMGVGYKG